MKKIILFLFLSILLNCKQIPVSDSTSESNEQISAASCTIEATIIKIPEPSSTDSSDVCFKNPCKAIVHVDKIIRCGSATTIIPDEKDEIKVHFAYSLNPTKDLFPSMKVTFPGLKTGSRFTASIEQRQVLGSPPEYIIFNYQVQ